MPFPDLVADPGAEDANTYADLEDALSYLEFRVGAGAWSNDEIDDDVKAQALVTATRELDTLDWRGERATATQALQWPRVGVSNVDDDEVPAAIRYATIELAFVYATQQTADATLDPVNPVASNLKRVQVGPIEREFFAPATTSAAIDVERLPGVVQRLVAPFLRTVIAERWGTGVVIRGS